METFIGISFVVLGALVASFMGVLAERANTGEGWVASRSRCNSCARTLGVADLLPVVSWAAFLGKCRTCRARIPGMYVLAELTLAALFALGYMRFGLTPALAPFLAALATLLFIVLYDLRHTVVPPLASNLLIAFSLCVLLLSSTDVVSLGLHLLTAGVIGLGFYMLHALSGGRAMGLGDAPVALALALLVGSAAVPGLLFSFWIGAAVGIVILVTRPKGNRMGIEVPFVPFLAVGFLLAFFTQWNPLTLPL